MNDDTIIDHVITDVTNHEIPPLPAVIETFDVSDHYPVFCQVRNITLSQKKNNFIGYYRNKSKFDFDTFNYDLYSAFDSYFMNLLEITNINFDEIFNKFTRIVLQVIDKHAPVKKFLVSKRNCLKNRGSLKPF